jgi:hypothetical protein
MKITDITRAYHRNGVCGEPFQVATFTMRENTDPPRRMVAVRFADDQSGQWSNPRIAVFDLALLAQGEIEFTVNSWRGDHFADHLDPHFFPKADHADLT